MQQKNPHFLFPQIHFGEIELIEELLSDEEDKEEEEAYPVPWTFASEPNTINPFEIKAGLYIHWIDHTQL